jgi:hypothetical protein
LVAFEAATGTTGLPIISMFSEKLTISLVHALLLSPGYTGPATLE